MIRILCLCSFLIYVSTGLSQSADIKISGILIEDSSENAIPFADVRLLKEIDSSYLVGSISDELGHFTLEVNENGAFLIQVSSFGYKNAYKSIFVGSASKFLDVGKITLTSNIDLIGEVEIEGTRAEIGSKMDKKVFSVDDNISQSGSSLLQTMQNLPGITIEDGKVALRGNTNVSILIDGKQSALAGIGAQASLDNIPASSIDRIEIITNPSSKFDANGNAGIINVILKKGAKNGFNGKVGIAGGLGSLWIRRENLLTIQTQYNLTPKVNPSLSFNYRKNKINLFFQGDYLYTETLKKHEFITRTYNDGTIIHQQSLRNRNTGFINTKTGMDWAINDNNALTVSAYYGTETIIDNGDQPFFNADYSTRIRLWSFLEDEVKTTAMASTSFNHNFKEPGHTFSVDFNYTFHREDEKYFFDNTLPLTFSTDAFKLLSDEHIYDFKVDYAKPLKNGMIQTGIKLRKRDIPTNMEFFPGAFSIIDSNAGGWANYQELIPAIYGNYAFENQKFDGEIGLRLELVDLKYEVNPDHNTYSSDGYKYAQPFPNVRFGYKMNDRTKVSLFYNRRVDRPAEVDIRIFPKYDDAEIIKVGNPELRPQFSSSYELALKSKLKDGYIYLSAYYRYTDGTITRISTSPDSTNLIYAIFQNVGTSYSTGIEGIITKNIGKKYKVNASVNVYQNVFESYTVENKYPVPHTFSANKSSIVSGSFKLNNTFKFTKTFSGQVSFIFMAPDILPQGKIEERYSLDFGVKKIIQSGKGDLFLNMTDVLNTMRIKQEFFGADFSYTSQNFAESQVIRIGYSRKF